VSVFFACFGSCLIHNKHFETVALHLGWQLGSPRRSLQLELTLRGLLGAYVQGGVIADLQRPHTFRAGYFFFS